MYLPSKIKPKHIGLVVLSVLIFILPFKSLVENIFVFFSRQLLFSPQKGYAKMLELEKRNLALTLKVRELQYLKPENERLRKALAFKEEKKTDLIGTEIVSLDPSTWRRIVVINAGKDKGINSGSYAIDEHGWLVGKIIEIGNTRSRLILIDDPNFSLPVFVGENSFGLLKGSLGGVKILYIENAEQIKAKDKVWLKISSLASPIYIGEIKKVIHDKDSLFLDVEAKIFSQNPFVHKIFIIK